MRRYSVIAAVVVLLAVMAAPVSAQGLDRIDVEGSWTYAPTGEDRIREFPFSRWVRVCAYANCRLPRFRAGARRALWSRFPRRILLSCKGTLPVL